jgi:hypothetical protein
VDKALVVDASPLILFSRIDRLVEMLREAGLRLKTAVMEEALAKVGE